MSGPTPIDCSTATPTAAPADFAMTWICPACGQVRAYEGGRPGEHDECGTCGARVEAPPIAKRAAASTNRYLF